MPDDPQPAPSDVKWSSQAASLAEMVRAFGSRPSEQYRPAPPTVVPRWLYDRGLRMAATDAEREDFRRAFVPFEDVPPRRRREPGRTT